MDKDKLTYLAAPFVHPDPDVQEWRMKAITKMAGELMNAGYLIFSPITHCYPIAKEVGLPYGWDFWGRYDEIMLRSCSQMAILLLPGWDLSKGVAAERRIATELGLPIEYLHCTLSTSK